MGIRGYFKKYSLWFVPGLMILVFINQLFMVSFLDLSRWKGGGMGMFSTLDDKRTAFVSHGGSAVYLPESLFQYKVGLEILPNAKSADRLWSALKGTLYFNEHGFPFSEPFLRIADLPDSIEIIRALYKQPTLEFIKANYTSITGGIIEVYAVNTYEVGSGRVSMKRIFSKLYSSE